MKDNFTGSGDGFLGVFDEKLRFGEFEREDLLSSAVSKIEKMSILPKVRLEHVGLFLSDEVSRIRIDTERAK